MATTQVRLRQFNISDLDDFWIWASDDKVTATCTWPTYTSKPDLLHYMHQNVVSNRWFLAIITGGKPVGSVTLTLNPTETDGRQCRGEIGYVVARDWWARGVATAAVREITAAAMEMTEGLERVEGLVEEGNRASQRVLEKVGFRREGLLRKYLFVKGVMRDFFVYSFVRGDCFLV